MASKQWAANKFFRFKLTERKLVREIDKRAKGANDNTDRVMTNYSFSKNGDRVWSF